VGETSDPPLLLNVGILAGNAARQRTLIAVSQIVLYCVKRSKDTGEKESDGGISPLLFQKEEEVPFSLQYYE